MKNKIEKIRFSKYLLKLSEISTLGVNDFTNTRMIQTQQMTIRNDVAYLIKKMHLQFWNEEAETEIIHANSSLLVLRLYNSG